MLPRERVAIGSGHEKGEFVGRLRHGDALDIGPRIPRLPLARGHLRVHESFHPHILRRPKRAREINQLGERKTCPGDRHAPGFDATMAVSPLFQRQLADQIVDADFHRLFHHAVNFHRPWPDGQRLGSSGDRFRGAEFIEIIVVAVDFLVSDRPVERIFLVALGGIKVGAWIRQLGHV